MTKPRIGLIATGGTISALGRSSLDIIDYAAAATMLHVDDLLARVPEAAQIADILPVRFANIPSYDIGFDAWQRIARDIGDLERQGALGIVITHGTASLEETAFFLHLTLHTTTPIVLVGSQRPLSALSTDAHLNLVNALRVAASPEAEGRGVLVVMNDEIHSARDVAKTSTFRLDTFSSPGYGPLGYADADRVHFRRRPEQPHTQATEFDVRRLDHLPRVDITLSYVGSDGAAVRAFLDAGARGIVAAGFPPGLLNGAETAALSEAVGRGTPVVVASRSGVGRVLDGSWLRSMRFIAAEDFPPQKARLLLQLALSRTSDPEEIARIFRTY